VTSEAGSLCLAVELFRTRGVARYDVAHLAGSPAHTLARRTSEPIDHVFVVNLIFPSADGAYQLVLYYGLLATRSQAAKRLLDRFRGGMDAFRNARFKLIPSVSDGPWLVKSAVGSRPALLGKTLKQRFFICDGITEVDVDCNSSPAAGRIVSLVKSYSRELTVDLAFVIEAQAAEELPEHVLGATRVHRVDLGDATVPVFAESESI
jgi:hypothetical protein